MKKLTIGSFIRVRNPQVDYNESISVSRSRESLEDSNRSVDSLQMDSNHSSLKSNGSATISTFVTTLSNDSVCSTHSGSGSHTPARICNSYESGSNYDSKKDSPASTVDSGIKTSPGNTLSYTSADGGAGGACQFHHQSTSSHQDSPTSYTNRNYFAPGSFASPSSNCGYFLSQRVLAAFFCQNSDKTTSSVGNMVHTLIYHAQVRLSPFRKLLEEDETLRSWASLAHCWKDPISAMEKALFNPVNQLLADGQIVGDYFIILLDSIPHFDLEMCQFVSQLIDILPSWAKLLCSCNKETLTCLSSGRRRLDIFNLEDPVKDCDITKDLDSFISHSVAATSNQVKELLTGSREISARFRNLLMSNCQRSFLYIRSCFDLINSGAITLTKQLNKNSLPASLSGMFELLCNQISHSSPAIYNKMRVIIDVIGCSFYPMTVEEIWAVVSHSKCSKEEFDRNFELLHGQFLIMRNNRTFEFSSEYLRSWFLDSTLSKKFCCDLRSVEIISPM